MHWFTEVTICLLWFLIPKCQQPVPIDIVVTWWCRLKHVNLHFPFLHVFYNVSHARKYCSQHKTLCCSTVYQGTIGSVDNYHICAWPLTRCTRNLDNLPVIYSYRDKLNGSFLGTQKSLMNCVLRHIAPVTTFVAAGGCKIFECWHFSDCVVLLRTLSEIIQQKHKLTAFPLSLSLYDWVKGQPAECHLRMLVCDWQLLMSYVIRSINNWKEVHLPMKKATHYCLQILQVIWHSDTHQPVLLFRRRNLFQPGNTVV